MDKEKITFIKEKEIKKQAQKNAEFFENAYMGNPIEAKFLAFKKTKKKINPKDLI